jgi:hypothetical protein
LEDELGLLKLELWELCELSEDELGLLKLEL